MLSCITELKSDQTFNREGSRYLSCVKKRAFSLLNNLKDIISVHVRKFCVALHHLLDIVSKVLLIRLDFCFMCGYIAGKGLSSWLSFVVSNCEIVIFPLVSWVWCGT